MQPAYSQKYTIVCFFYPQSVPATFSALDWPLHVTILDTFKTDWPADILCNRMRQVASDTTAFEVLPMEQAMLGPDKNVPVRLLQKDAAMLSLHAAFLSLSDEGAFVFNTPEFVGKGFLPHATDQQDSRLELGKRYELTTLSLVDMFPHGDHMQRTIIETFTMFSSH